MEGWTKQRKTVTCDCECVMKHKHQHFLMSNHYCYKGWLTLELCLICLPCKKRADVFSSSAVKLVRYLHKCSCTLF